VKWRQYIVYGLVVDSDTALPELVSGPAAQIASCPDVRVRLGDRQPHVYEPLHWLFVDRLPDGAPWMGCAKVEHGYLVRFFRFADFRISPSANEVVCTRVEAGTSSETVRHLLLNQVFPLVLSRLGRQALHATAVVTPSGVCAFAGPTGSGKSTLAASFFMAGYPVFGDDCLALSSDDRIMATPAYPGVRLWGDAAAYLLGEPQIVVPVAQYTPKRRALGDEIARNFPNDPLPLIRVYRPIKDDKGATCPSVESLSPREAFMEVVSVIFLLDVDDRATLSRHFCVVRRIVAEVPVKRLRMPNDLSALPAVRRAVLADLENIR
jgi:hypothetical protein